MDAYGEDATVTFGPTSGGMVRIPVEAAGAEIPMDFEPDGAEEIAAGRACRAERRGGAATRTGARPYGGRR